MTCFTLWNSPFSSQLRLICKGATNSWTASVVSVSKSAIQKEGTADHPCWLGGHNRCICTCCNDLLRFSLILHMITISMSYSPGKYPANWKPGHYFMGATVKPWLFLLNIVTWEWIFIRNTHCGSYAHNSTYWRHTFIPWHPYNCGSYHLLVSQLLNQNYILSKTCSTHITSHHILVLYCHIHIFQSSLFTCYILRLPTHLLVNIDQARHSW